MARCWQATSHYPSQCWPRSMSPYGINGPQLLKDGILQDGLKTVLSLWQCLYWSSTKSYKKNSCHNNDLMSYTSTILSFPRASWPSYYFHLTHPDHTIKHPSLMFMKSLHGFSQWQKIQAKLFISQFFSTNPHIKHSMAHKWGHDIVSLLWFHILICILNFSLSSKIDGLVTIDVTSLLMH